MMRIKLSFPSEFFTKKFLDCYAEKGLGIKGDALIENIKMEHRGKNLKGILFSDKVTYICNLVGNKVLLIGTN